MSEPMTLPSLEISNFRAIRHMRLSKLARVNLFVGKNNSGKSSLLEAVQLFGSRSPGVDLVEIVDRHNGLRPGMLSFGDENKVDPEELRWMIDAYLGLICGSYADRTTGRIEIGPVGAGAELLAISLPWLPEYYGGSLAGMFFTMDSAFVKLERSGDSVTVPLAWLLRGMPIVPRFRAGDVVYIPPAGFSKDDLYDLWRETSAQGHAEEAEAVVRVILPDLERILVINENGYGLAAQLKSARKPIPLASMGDGTNRVVGLALAFLNAQGSVVLVDEIENGLHHGVQFEVWDSVFELARRLKVQVFATTHNWETVVAFQHAANRSDAEGLLYRLEREREGVIYAEHYTEEELAIVAEQQVEVR